MSISRPFSYNPTLETEGVSEQFGSLSVGFTGQTYGDSPGGLKWWEGPDEELGYVIATVLPVGGILAPDGIYGDVTFWRTNTPSESEFITLSNELTGQNFSTATEATQWLNSNGYWASFVTLSQLYNILVGGVFTTYQTPKTNYLTSLNTNGSINNLYNTESSQLDSEVIDIAVQSDGKIVVGGNFVSVGTWSISRLTRFNTDGTRDESFMVQTGFDMPVHSVKIQTDGKIVVGGMFQYFDGIYNVNRIIRLDSSGYFDSSFNMGFGFNSTVNSIDIQSDGKIIVGGYFTEYNFNSTIYICRLESNGSLDSSFFVGTGFNGTVNKVLVQSDGKILVGGDFTSYDGTSSNRIIRLNSNGYIDTSFNVGTGFNGNVTNLSIQSDGKIIVTGIFSQYNNQSIVNIARLNSNGTLDTSFTSGFLSGAAYTSLIQPDGKIIVGGAFPNYSNISRNNIVRINSDGSIDTSFDVAGGFNNSVFTIKLGTNGEIITGGSFTAYDPKNFFKLISLEDNGDPTIGFGSQVVNGTVRTIEKQPDFKMLLGGEFTAINGISSNRIGRLNIDGTLDSTFSVGTGFNGFPYDISIQSDGKILVGGDFTTYSGISTNRIIRLNSDGSIDPNFVIGPRFNNQVNTISLQSDGKILVGGNFTTYQGASNNYIIRLNTDGSIDSLFDNGTAFNNFVVSVKIQSDGKILVGGNFTTYNGISSNRIIRLNSDGSIDTSFTIGNGFNNNLSSIQIQSDGKILVIGAFTTYNNISSNRIIRLNSDGSIDTSFNVGTGFGAAYGSGGINPLSIEIQSDGKILVGGDFGSYNNISANKLIKLNSDGTIDTSFNVGAGFNNQVLSIKQ